MTTLQKTHRADFIRQRRTSKTPLMHTTQRSVVTPRKTYHQDSVYLPTEPHLVPRRSTTRKANPSARNGYDIAFSLGRTKVHAPSLNIPHLGSRWISGGMTLLLGFLLLAMLTASPFEVKGAEVVGNQRIGTADINSTLGIIGEPVFKAVPSQIVANLHTAYPDLASIKVKVGLPNRITVDVVERKPVLAWYQNGVMTWIDANGVAFTPR